MFDEVSPPTAVAPIPPREQSWLETLLGRSLAVVVIGKPLVVALLLASFGWAL